MKKIILFKFVFFWAAFACAQLHLERDVIASAGDLMGSGGLSVSWTMGETMTETYQPGLAVCQGFQQGDKLANSLTEPGLPFPVQVFPNPTWNDIQIVFDAEEVLTAELVDLTGKVILIRELEAGAGHYEISFGHLPASMYVLRIANRKGNSSYFKIQKF